GPGDDELEGQRPTARRQVHVVDQRRRGDEDRERDPLLTVCEHIGRPDRERVQDREQDELDDHPRQAGEERDRAPDAGGLGGRRGGWGFRGDLAQGRSLSRFVPGAWGAGARHGCSTSYPIFAAMLRAAALKDLAAVMEPLPLVERTHAWPRSDQTELICG